MFNMADNSIYVHSQVSAGKSWVAYFCSESIAKYKGKCCALIKTERNVKYKSIASAARASTMQGLYPSRSHTVGQGSISWDSFDTLCRETEVK